jgi:hypothetical protein
VAITIKKRFSKRIRGATELLFFRFYREKIEKKFYEGVAVAGSPTAGSATASINIVFIFLKISTTFF